jgi:Flp pilus assembly protein TadG
VVEFALVLPLLLLVVLAIVQIGALARDELLVVQAARAGAREAAVRSDQAAISTAALRAAPGLDPERTSVAIDRTGSLGDPVAVTVTYVGRIAVPLAGWLLPPEVLLSATATMRQEFG